MWCDGEKFIQLNNDDAREVLHGELQVDGTIKDAKGRIAYGPGNPLFERGRRAEKYKKYLDPAVLRSDPDMRKSQWKQLGFIKASRFFMPPLPQSAERYYAELDPKVRDEVDQLRCYWASLRGFKDKLRMSRWVMMTFFILPGALLLGVYTASLERTPFTGRWRIILLTPDEEDKISTSLAGPNWYTSVINLLTTAEAPAPPVVPLNDWRWAWVRGVLHQLEKAVVRAAEENAAGQPTTWPDSLEAIPTPSKYPLRPRPRLMSHLHSSLPGGEPKSGKEHLELGPPYSLLLMQKDERNAFSYGFGGKGAGGVVVFTGLLDDILRHGRAEEVTPEPRGFFGALFGSTPVPKRAEPTEEQTLHLACVLAHEMGHLLLSHHLETLSQQQVLWPSMLGFSMDLIRAFIWPFT
jgi:Zn-dependent protease with chaperone function